MNTFIHTPFTINNINNIVYVAPGTGKPVHKNRLFHGLVYYPKQSPLFIFDNGIISSASEQCIIYLPKHSNYHVKQLPNYTESECYAINFDLSEKFSHESFVMKLKADAKIQTIFHSCEKTWSTKEAGYYAKCMSLLYEIIYMMQNDLNTNYLSAGNKQKLKVAMEYIQANYLTEDIHISYLAELCNMGETYFRKLFHSQYHVSPVKYIHSLKIARAKELITSDMYSIRDVATLSGFHDDCYFRKIFMRETSLSPTEYLKMSKISTDKVE